MWRCGKAMQSQYSLKKYYMKALTLKWRRKWFISQQGVVDHQSLFGANRTGDNLGVSPPVRKSPQEQDSFQAFFSLCIFTANRNTEEVEKARHKLVMQHLVVSYYFYLIPFQTLHFLSALLLSMLRGNWQPAKIFIFVKIVLYFLQLDTTLWFFIFSVILLQICSNSLDDCAVLTAFQIDGLTFDSLVYRGVRG